MKKSERKVLKVIIEEACFNWKQLIDYKAKKDYHSAWLTFMRIDALYQIMWKALGINTDQMERNALNYITSK